VKTDPLLMTPAETRSDLATVQRLAQFVLYVTLGVCGLLMVIRDVSAWSGASQATGTIPASRAAAR
jgi:hypothetical protein